MIQCESVPKNRNVIQTSGEFSLRARFPERYEQLLRAALLKGKLAVKAWDDYATNHSCLEIEKDFENEPYLLLPLLYHNLEDHGQSDKLPTKYAGVYRYTWTRNQNLFRDAAQIIKLFLNAGIETLILKGAALSITHYQNLGLRRLQDIDVAVRAEKLEAAVQILEKKGWTLQTTSLLNQTFENSNGNRLDLHWFVGEDDWEQATPVMIQDVPTRTLNPTDHLDFICSVYKWHVLLVADVFMLLNHSSYSIEWERLIKNRKDAVHIFALRTLLHYLSIVLEVDIPVNILNDLENRKIGLHSYLHFVAVVCPAKVNSQNPIARLREIWFCYRQSIQRNFFFTGLIEFPLYLCYRWNLNRWWEFPFSAISRFIARW